MISALGETIGNPTQGAETSTTQTALLGIVLQRLEDGKLGFNALINRFHENGLTDHAKSWVGKGENKRVSCTEIEQALGKEHIEAIAKEAGIPPEEVAAELCDLLPMLIDKFTPDGKIPEPAVIQQAASLLRTKIS